MNEELMLKVDNVYKKYRLGTIGGGTLTADLQSWWAKVRHKEDPNSKIGSKSYGKNETFYALNGISFEVKKGEALGIIGGNGAGKSTTLKLLSQVTAPTEGSIYLNGRVASMLEVGTGFHPELTGRENIYLNGAILGMSKAEIDKKIDEIIDFSECRQFIDTPVKRYSSGMYVKLAFSVAAHLDSEIMIMDEVLAVGDMAFQKKCIDKMVNISQNEGRTILYVSHNMSTIKRLCSRCIVLNKGEKIFDGDTDDAIEIYMSSTISQMSPVLDVDKFERPSYSLNHAHLQKIEFLETDSCVYDLRSKIKLKLTWISNRTLDDVKARILVSSTDGTPVGLAYSDTLANANEGDVLENTIELDLRDVVEGKYKLTISLFQNDSSGNSIIIDTLADVAIFEIKPQYGTKVVNWSKSWGNINFPDMKVESCNLIK